MASLNCTFEISKMKLAFIRNKSAYLPEIDAYKSYIFEHYPNIEITEHNRDNVFDLQCNSASDICWRFMGIDTPKFHHLRKKPFIIHDYNSLSTKPFPRFKNKLKKMVNVTPNLRIFLNKEVKDGFGFDDGVPFVLRTMGVSKSFFEKRNSSPKKYDFICIGGFDRGSVVTRFLDKFTYGELLKHSVSILLVGDLPEKIFERYSNFGNIIMKKRVSNDQIPTLISQSKFGVNLVPDIYPYNLQPATKILEYSAVGTKIITTDYQWIRIFENKHQGSFFKLDNEMSNFTLSNLAQFKFIHADVGS